MNVGIKYIGRKASKFDNVADTGFTWTQGEVLMVPAGRARLLLRHPDVWEQVDGPPLTPAELKPRGLSNPTNAEPTAAPRVLTAQEEPAPVNGEQMADSRFEDDPEDGDVSAQTITLPPGIKNMSAQQLANLIQRNFGEHVEITNPDGSAIPAATIRQRLIAMANGAVGPRVS